jgi:tRNA(Ile)-lysidine synthase
MPAADQRRRSENASRRSGLANEVTRFNQDLDRLVPDARRIGLAVSGGPDSLALLLLAAAARPGEVEAATVDHGIRTESADEVVMVEEVCASLGVPHATLRVTVVGRSTPFSRLTTWTIRRKRCSCVWRGEQDWVAWRGSGPSIALPKAAY